MNQLEGISLFLCLNVVLLLSGYWLAARHTAATPPERLAMGVLAGLATLLLLVAGVNFFRPLSGVWAGLCLLPAVGTLAGRHSRQLLLADVRPVYRSLDGRLALGWAALFMLLLLLPVLHDGRILYYDGTSNHDSFIWITSAEYLQHHSYMDQPVQSATQPWLNTAGANVGWNPSWGRMGAEGLLALWSSLAFTAALDAYLYGTAALFLPWVAAVFLTVSTFYRARLSRAALATLFVLQPIFIFFYANSNLPNLVGVIMGAAAVIAVEQALRSETGRLRLAWCVLLLLSLHGLYASYPEMIPFILLPCGLLWLRFWFNRQPRLAWKPALMVAAGVLTSVLINPATSIRAWRGFVTSYQTARADQSWANLFEPLNPAGYLPGLATLSIPAARQLGLLAGAGLSLLIVAACLLGWWRARDRFGFLAALAGSAVLLGYTLVTGFNYGWQKTAQFGGIFIAALVPVALADSLFQELRTPGARRWLSGAALGVVAWFFAAATWLNFQDMYAWGRNKSLSADWQTLRETSRTTLRENPVLVDAASFRMPFFHGMWAAYFLPESRIYFAERGVENGGYLRDEVLNEKQIPEGRPAAVLVGRDWASTFDANSRRLLVGREYALVREANRVVKMQGVYPLNGVPEHASTGVSLEILPHSPARLRLTLAPYLKKNWPAASWRISHRAGAGPENILTVSGAPPWQFEVPLVAHQANLIEFATVPPAGSTEILPFAITVLKIESAP